MSGDRHLADDLAQTALVKTYAAWSKVRRDDAMAYTRRVLVNANIDRLRRRRTRPAEVSDTLVGAVADWPAPAHTQAVDDRDELVRLLGGLTERERKVLVLRYYFDLAEVTVADELGISVGTVKSTAAKACMKLRATVSTEAVDVVKEVN